ncbi:uncharacterized protein TRUGW13939_10508 [Talaromyces rugulosus]|uniref:inorganic diphosphatase n=1 Tax=Talaromyces rugulosus TaxID=121627 RepID=A0A7H8RBE4_TALRU|nr:uncharacterized protein TRUGW13939_10508 [Talaromyces rugulosus]QKX63338.1 hypothetical protein TRUGW13939_10508 [Talaromyces rugulosus]
MSPSPKYQTQVSGSVENGDFQLSFAADNGSPISPWHDIPLMADSTERIFHMVVEIPRGSRPKMEIAKEVPGNPIKQDMTWEDPSTIDSETNANGDDDPLDVCEIGSRVSTVGEVKRVKVLGAFVIIDQGETDWKVVAVDVEDPLATKLNDISDVEANTPGFMASLKNWFCMYKVPEGKKANTLPLGQTDKTQSYALDLIDRCHNEWHSCRRRLLERSHKSESKPDVDISEESSA